MDSSLMGQKAKLEAQILNLQIEVGGKARREAELIRDLEKLKVEERDLQIHADGQAQLIAKLRTEHEKLKSTSEAANTDHQALKVKYETLGSEIREYAEALQEGIGKLNEESRSSLEKIRKIRNMFNSPSLSFPGRSAPITSARVSTESSPSPISTTPPRNGALKSSSDAEGQSSFSKGKRPAPPAFHSSISNPVSKRQKLQHYKTENEPLFIGVRNPATHVLNFSSPSAHQKQQMGDTASANNPLKRSPSSYSLSGQKLSRVQQFHPVEYGELNLTPKGQVPRSTGAASGHGGSPVAGRTAESGKAKVLGRYKKVSIEEVEED